MGKYKIGDHVRIKVNRLEPKYVGKVGRISKVYESYDEAGVYSTVYRVNVGGKLLKGVACEEDIEPSND